MANVVKREERLKMNVQYQMMAKRLKHVVNFHCIFVSIPRLF
jgi:hypothetical protein